MKRLRLTLLLLMLMMTLTACAPSGNSMEALSVTAAPQEDDQLSLTDVGGSQIAEELRTLDLNTITPIEAMNLLFELQKKARG